MRRRWSVWCLSALVIATATSAAAQRIPVPRPFPTVGESTERAAAQPATGTPTATETVDGVPVYPNADHLDTFDGGRGQTLHLYGTNATFDEMVRYYSVVLDERGDRVFDAPATHQFDTSRFRDDRMNYRPSVTIKDYMWNGSEGYLNPVPGAEPARYRTVIQITTAPPGEAQR